VGGEREVRMQVEVMLSLGRMTMETSNADAEHGSLMTVQPFLCVCL
jgi:hypothetical protein